MHVRPVLVDPGAYLIGSADGPVFRDDDIDVARHALQQPERGEVVPDRVLGGVQGASVTGLDAGHHALLRLPAGVDERLVAARARAHGVAVRGLDDYRVTADDETPGVVLPPALVIGFGK